MIRHQLFIAVALLVGVGIGYFVRPSGEDASGGAESAGYKARTSVADRGDRASLKSLRRRVAELEKLLAEKDPKTEVAVTNAVAARPPEPPRQSWRERMEALKKDNPQEYARRTNWWAQVRRNRAEQARDKIDFLSSVDNSQMSADARKTHDALQELIARREEIEAQLQEPNLSDEERGKLFGELRSSHHELMRLNGEERRNLIDETARNLGFKGEEAQEFSATIQEIIRATDSGWGRPGRRGPGGPGGR